MINFNNDNFTENEDISLKDMILKIGEWWRFLVSKWVLILCAGLVGVIIGFTYAYFKKPIYKAELSFALEDDKSSGGGLSSALGLASQFGIDIGAGGGGNSVFSGDNLITLMKSRSMVENTLLTVIDVKGEKQTLADYYITINDYRKAWKNKPELINVHFLPNADVSKFSLQQDSLLGVFYKDLTKGTLSVDKVDKKLSIITVKVTSENELFSKYFTEILVKTVSDFYVDTKTKKSVQNVQILQRQTDSVRRQLNAAITGVASTSDLNPNANPSLLVLRAPTQRRQVDVQANTAILTELVKNLEISKVSLRKETPLVQIVDRPILPLEKEKTSKLKGIIIGGFVAGFFMTLFLFLKQLFKILLA